MNCRQLQSKTNNSSNISDFETNLAHVICLFNLLGTTASKETEDQSQMLIFGRPSKGAVFASDQRQSRLQ